jgi:HEAT repeat protein
MLLLEACASPPPEGEVSYPVRPPAGRALAVPAGPVGIQQIGPGAQPVPPPPIELKLVTPGGPDMANASVTDLVGYAAHGPVEQRVEAITKLGLIGPSAAEAVPALAERVKDEQRQVRSAAIQALGRIGPNVPETIPALTAALDDQDGSIRGAAAKILGRFGAAARDAVPALVHVLRYGGPIYGGGLDSAPVRRAAAQALGQIGPAARGAVPVLNEMLQDPDFELRRLVIEALNRIGG